MILLLNHASLDVFDYHLIVNSARNDYKNALDPKIPVTTLGSERGNKLLKLIYFLKIIHREKPDIIVSHLFEQNMYLLIVSYLIPRKIRIVITPQNNLSQYLRLHYPNPVHRYFRFQAFKFFLYRADRVFTVSAGIKAEYKRLFGLKDEKIKVIYNPVDIQKINRVKSDRLEGEYRKLIEGKSLIVGMGRLSIQKGYFDMLQVMKYLVQLNPDVVLFILGNGNLKTEIRAKILEYNLMDYVYLLGFQENPWKFIDKAEVFLSTSYFEGLPLNLLEAMACNKIVVSTNCDFGPSEILTDNVNGFLFQIGDCEGMAEKINDIISFKIELNHIKPCIIKTVGAFEARKISSRIEQFYLTDLMNHGEPGKSA